nr:DUF5057 domain-containing protein [uncultured Lachnoclostridium sp.]
MKNKILIVSILIGIIAVLFLGSRFGKEKKSTAAVVLDDGKIEIPVRNSDSPLGAEDNPFIILEIVPYEGYAEIGYLIGGQEPVNIKRVGFGPFGGTIGSTNAITGVGQNVETFFPSKDMIEIAKPSHYTKDQYGYYERVGKGKGDYKQVDVTYDKAGKILTANYQKVENGLGDYLWVGYENGITHSETTNHNADKVFTTKKSELYQAYVYTYTNRNVFLKQCLLLTEEQIPDYHIKVITVTAAQINNNLSLIDRADLIYITDKNHNGYGFIHMWNSIEYRRNDMFSYGEVLPDNLEYNNQIRFLSPGRDFSWEAVVRILKKKLGVDLPEGEYSCPVIYDTSSLTSNITTEPVTIEKKMKDQKTTYLVNNVQGSSNNAYKLGLMLRQMDTYDLYELYFKTGMITTTTRDDGMTTGKFNELIIPNGAKKDFDGDPYPTLFWAADTLYPYHLVNYDHNVNHLLEDLNELGYRWNDFGGNNTEVEDNTYIYNGDTSLNMSFTTASVFYETHTKEVFDYFFPTLSIEQKKTKTLTPAQIVQFLLVRNTIGREFDRDIRILEIEPCNDFKSDLQWESYIYGLLPGFKHQVIVDKQTTKEFIGKVEDLNGTYDLIYLGLRDAALGQASFRDTTMRNLIYMHVGDLVMLKQVAEGHNLVSWDTTVKDNPFPVHLAGNDITKRRKEELLSYARAGYPIILQDAFFSNINEVNKIKVDTASFMYQLVDTLKKDSRYNLSLFLEDKVSVTAFEAKLRKNFITIAMSKQPITYKDKITKAEQGDIISDVEIYVNGADRTNKTLTYEFIIRDMSVGERYGLSLYLDLNSDGYFDPAIERQQIENIISKEDNRLVKANALKENTSYVLSLDVSTFQGVLPWKLSIERLESDLSYSGIRRDITGMAAIKNTNEKKVELKILQLYSKNRLSIALPTEEDINKSGADSFPTEEETKEIGVEGLKKKIINSFVGNVTIDDLTFSEKNNNANLARATGLFYYYTKDLEDYQITFERISVERFVELCNQDSSAIDISGYDMLIIGFADMCTDLSGDTATNKIKDFANQGKTILFTHDTTFVTSTHKTTSAFKEMLGMDRFGMMLKRDGMAIEDIVVKKDLPYIPNKQQIANGSNVFFKQLYGYTDQTALRFTSANPIDLRELTTKYVTKVNDGQITSYPYAIDETVMVAPTHHQYFQLDMENPDIVVWYCLKTDLNNTSREAYEKNDVRNGYYIYSKGNITYSGAGHMLNAALFGEMPDMEVKLFVNTIVAAYRSTPAVSKIIINNEDKTSSDGIVDYLYVDYDTSNTENAIGNGIEVKEGKQTKRLLFTLLDDSVFTNKKTILTYTLMQFDNKEEVIESQTLPLVTREVSTDRQVEQNAVVANTPYYINVPLEFLKHGKGGYMGVKIDLTLNYGSNSEYTLKNSKEVIFLRRALFDLD